MLVKALNFALVCGLRSIERLHRIGVDRIQRTDFKMIRIRSKVDFGMIRIDLEQTPGFIRWGESKF